jgi:hypothetical protein|tara:strand:+ start:274 stop:474 length:201 start_codon:yes stop_codon:yes gene_type:complete
MKKVIITLSIEERHESKFNELVEVATIVQERQEGELNLLDSIYEIVNDPDISTEIHKTEQVLINLN